LIVGCSLPGKRLKGPANPDQDLSGLGFLDHTILHINAINSPIQRVQPAVRYKLPCYRAAAPNRCLDHERSLPTQWGAKWLKQLRLPHPLPLRVALH